MTVDPMELVIQNSAVAIIAAIQTELGVDDPINKTKVDGTPLARVIALVPGNAIVWDVEGDCYGMLTARLSNLAAHRPPNRTATLTPCSIDYWTATMEITLLRCAGTVSNSGHAPTVNRLNTDGFLGASDLGAMLRALYKVPFLDDITQWIPQGPDGGRFGTQILASFKLDSPPCV